MSDFLVILLIVIGVVAFFVLAMSLTLLLKGHHLKSEISDNKAMRERGIKCVLHEEGRFYGSDRNSCGCGSPEDCREEENGCLSCNTNDRQ